LGKLGRVAEQIRFQGGKNMASERVQKLQQELVQALLEEGVTAEEFALDSMPFAEMELFGHQFGKQIAAEIQTALAEAQASQLNQQAAHRYNCPSCGRAARADTSPRRLTTLDGDVEFGEPKCFCKTCRKAFFPSA